MRDGGQAFPRAGSRYPGWTDGMSLRDYFAGQVLGQCQIVVDTGTDAPSDVEIQTVAERYARAAYIIADAMLSTRNR